MLLVATFGLVRLDRSFLERTGNLLAHSVPPGLLEPRLHELPLLEQVQVMLETQAGRSRRPEAVG